MLVTTIIPVKIFISRHSFLKNPNMSEGAQEHRLVYCQLVRNAFKVDPVMTFEAEASPAFLQSGGQGRRHFWGPDCHDFLKIC